MINEGEAREAENAFRKVKQASAAQLAARKLSRRHSKSDQEAGKQNFFSIPDAQNKDTTTTTTTTTTGPIRPVALRPVPVRLGSNVPVQPKRNVMRSAKSLARKYKKPSWYHDVAAKNRLGSIQEDAFIPEIEQEAQAQAESDMSPSLHTSSPQQFAIVDATPEQQAKKELLDALNRADGDTNTPAFKLALQKLLSQYDNRHFDPRKPVPRYARACAANQLEGIGISAGKPTFPGCVGRNAAGDPMYKLGTMSFDMFCPTQLVVSVQGSFVLIDAVDGRDPNGVKNIPMHLFAEVRFGKVPVRTYNIVTPLTIEPWREEFGDDSPNKGVDVPVQGVMTTFGFLLPYPTKHRFAVWFTGGCLEVDSQKNEKWFQIFDKDTVPKRTAAERGKLLAAKLLMGASATDHMDQDGKLSYSLSRPRASHVDLLYLDKTLQILQSGSGTAYVHVRLPGSDVVQESASSDELFPVSKEPLFQAESFTSPTLIAGSESRGLSQKLEEPSRISPTLRKMASESALQDCFPQDNDSTADARLAELQSYAINNPQSCLKKASSYGDLEAVGTNIPILGDNEAWMVLPKPTGKCHLLPSHYPNRQRDRKSFWRLLQRSVSDPSLLAPSSSDPAKPSSELDEGDMTDTDSTDSEEDSNKGKVKAQSRPKLRKAVSFSCLEIRRYDLTVGDNPSCSSGPPVSLDWTYQTTAGGPMSIRAYEFAKHNGRHRGLRTMDSKERLEKLKREFDVQASEIHRASQEVQKIKAQRAATNRYVNMPAALKMEETIEDAIESVQRKARRITHRMRPPDHSASRGFAGVA